MNNYHALIENLRQCAKEWMNPGPTALREAADAIENLTAELAEERQNHDRLQDWDRGMTEKLASAELQCKQVNEGAAILMKRLSDALEELERAQKRIAELEGEHG